MPEWKTSYSNELAVWAATPPPITLTAPSNALANFSSGVKAEVNMSRIFASFGIAKGFAAASILTVVASAPASAQLKWDLSTAPMQYLQYDLPYYKLALGSFPNYQDLRLKPHLVVGRYGGLYAYAPHAIANAAAMVVAAPIPYIGHDLTPFYNLAPGCPLGSNTPGHTNQIC